METQNITLALPKDLLRKIKVIAAQRGTSVSALMRASLEELASREDSYAAARERHLAWLEHGADLGTGGKITWTRDDLHER